RSGTQIAWFNGLYFLAHALESRLVQLFGKAYANPGYKPFPVHEVLQFQKRHHQSAALVDVRTVIDSYNLEVFSFGNFNGITHLHVEILGQNISQDNIALIFLCQETPADESKVIEN